MKVKARTLVISFFSLALFCLTFYLFFLLVHLNKKDVLPDAKNAERKFCILVAGTSETESYVRQVFRGAELVAEKYDCAIEYFISDSKDKFSSTQDLFNYASYINADGAIIYIDGKANNLSIPCHSDGKPIPLITIGHYEPQLNQLSFIGINYSGLGQIFANEIIKLVGEKGTVCLFDTRAEVDANYSTLMNSLLNATSRESSIQFNTILLNKYTTFSMEDSARQQLASAENIDAIVSLSEESTVLAAQTVIDLNIAGQITILGFGDSDDSYSYFEKGIVTELISINSVEIGKRAIAELFEFINTGYANSYVIADVEVMKK